MRKPQATTLREHLGTFAVVAGWVAGIAFAVVLAVGLAGTLVAVLWEWLL